MSKYIGTPVVNISADTVDVTGDITTTDATPEVIIVNNTHEDTDGGREGKVTFKGQQTGGEETTLAQIQASHDGTSDDEKGDLIFKTNDGSDGASPTERLRIDSAGFLDSVSTSNDVARFSGPNSGGVTFRNDTSNEFQMHTGTSDALIFGTNGENQRMRITSDGDIYFYEDTSTNVKLFWDASAETLAIGHSSASTSPLSVGGNTTSSTKPTVAVVDTTNGASLSLRGRSPTIWMDCTAGGNGKILMDGAEIQIKDGNIDNEGTVRALIDTSGNFIVGHTSTSGILTSNSQTGGYLNVDGGLVAAKSSDAALKINRQTSIGEVAQFRQGGALVGRIAVDASGVYFGDSDTGIFCDGVNNAILPANTNTPAVTDNFLDLGKATTGRFDDVHATNGTIQTSDENEKQNIAPLTNAEITAATAISKLFKTFKWKDKVAAKGDNARTHTGVIAQQVENAMSDAGLDASKYAFWCSNTWWEKDVEVAAVEADEENDIEAKDAYTRTNAYDTQEEAPEGATERNRKGIRYPELLAFVGAATEQRLTSIEARLTALEGE